MRGPLRQTLMMAGLWLAAGLAASLPAAAQQDSLVRVDAVQREPLAQTVPVIGRLVARQAGEIAARIAGPVAEFFVEVGDRVDKDEVIAVLDSKLLKARRDLATGRLNEGLAELKTSRAEVALARQELQRMEGLKSSAAFSQARFDDANQSVAIAEAKSKRAEAGVASARAELQVYEINLTDAMVLAPYPGVVIQRMSEAGAYVQIGAPLVRLIADRSLEVEVEVPFQRLGGLTDRRVVQIALDDGSTHEATVRAVLPSENPLTRTRVVRLTPRFSETTIGLADSQSVTVLVPAGATREVLTVHKDALLRRQGGVIVFVVVDGMAEARTITIGEGLGNRVEILNGLADGDVVVVRGNERLHPGAKVRIAGES